MSAFNFEMRKVLEKLEEQFHREVGWKPDFHKDEGKEWAEEAAVTS